MSGNIDKHPLRYSPVTAEIEKILTRRVHAKRFDGYTLETAIEIAALVMPGLELYADMSASNPSTLERVPVAHKVKWRDWKRDPQCAPNPAYPTGIDLDTSGGAERTCTVVLPYPAKRCGVYVIDCPVCGLRYGCTTAGRPDDPKSIKLACRIEAAAVQ